MNIGSREISSRTRQRKGSSPGLHPAPIGALNEDTASDCQDRALADLALAATMDTINGRLQMERSAKSWMARADSLQSDQSEEHRSRLRAEWNDDEDDLAP